MSLTVLVLNIFLESLIKKEGKNIKKVLDSWGKYQRERGGRVCW
jgi:hypothetical protein